MWSVSGGQVGTCCNCGSWYSPPYFGPFVGACPSCGSRAGRVGQISVNLPAQRSEVSPVVAAGLLGAAGAGIGWLISHTARAALIGGGAGLLVPLVYGKLAG